MPKADDKIMLSSAARWVLVLTALGLSLALTAAAAKASTPAMRPLAELLNPDGTLNLTTGYRGSLDPSGRQLISGPDEPPRFAPQTAPLAVPGNQDWAANFSFRGVSGTVNSLAVDTAGNVYAGGLFAAAGGVPASNVAKWNGSAWSAMSYGFNNSVRALAVDGSNVYAGGSFSLACDATCSPATSTRANYIARWNGTAWLAMSNGFNGAVNALVVDSNHNVYAGGNFSLACGATCSPVDSTAVNRIAQWNGASWSAMANGFDGTVYALAVDSGSNVYAGGGFTLACDATCASGTSTTVNHVAKWSGITWSPLENGFANSVTALAVDGSNSVYAGGVFTNLCAAGSGCPAGGAPVNRVASWDGAHWSPMGNGVSSQVLALTVDASGNVYAGGAFTLACDATCNPTTSTTVNYAAEWSGGTWSALGSGFNSLVNALARNGSNVYAGGSFSSSGSTPFSFVAQWGGSPASWSALGAGDALSNSVFALARDSSDNLYAGGDFTWAGGVNARHIATWNGTTWSAVGNGFNGAVWALAVDGSGNMYASGEFTAACDATCNPATSIIANRVAMWDGDHWSAMGNGFNQAVLALAVDSNNHVYAGGLFTNLCGVGPGCPVGGARVNRIAQWNGSGWSAMGNGFGGAVVALAVDSHNHVYAGGSMTVACDATCGAASTPVNHIASWNGSTWSGLGYGFENPVWALTMDAGNLYAGGGFTYACDATCSPATSTTVNHIATWDGGTWSALASGTNDDVNALAIRGKTLFVGGGFTIGGGKASGHIASVRIGQLYLPVIRR